jgi:hypothetical protein
MPEISQENSIGQFTQNQARINPESTRNREDGPYAAQNRPRTLILVGADVGYRAPPNDEFLKFRHDYGMILG